MPQAEKFTLPENYTFTPGGILIHKDAFERLDELLKKAQNRDPDAFGMYIYNDYFGYGVLDLVDETLSSVHTFAIKKEWMKAWNALVALTHFNLVFSDWANVDDGERVRITDKTYGALLVTTIRALEAAGKFNEENIPGLELCLKFITDWGDMFGSDLGNKYTKVVKGLGKSLFGDRTEEERKRRGEEMDKAYEEFVKSLSEAERKKRGDAPQNGQNDDDDDDDDDEDEDEDEEEGKGKGKGKGPWYGKAKAADATHTHSSFKYTPIWREYKNYIAGVPRLPVRGPPVWDITKWPADAKKKLSFDSMDD